VKNCTDVHQNLAELYRRVAFNILIGNTDDHFRNHGFLLTRKGWTLAPAYDLNPTTGSHQCLLINRQTEKSDIEILRQSCENYLLERREADEIIAQIFEAKNDWKNVAKNGEISLQFLAPYFA